MDILMIVYKKEYIIVDEADALDLHEISNMESVKFYKKLPSGQYLYDFWNNELSDLAKYQQNNPIEYAQRMIDDEEFEKKCLNIINTRYILTYKGSENYMKRYYTYSDNIANVVFDYLSFNRYMHQIFVEINKKTTIEFEYVRMKKKTDILLSWITDINIDYKIDKKDSKIKIILGDIRSIDWAMIMVFLMNVRINKRVDFLLNVDHENWAN